MNRPYALGTALARYTCGTPGTVHLDGRRRVRFLDGAASPQQRLVRARVDAKLDVTLGDHAECLKKSCANLGYELDQPVGGHIDVRPNPLLRLITPGKEGAPSMAVAWSVVWREHDRVWILRRDVHLGKGLSMAAERRALLGVVRFAVPSAVQER